MKLLERFQRNTEWSKVRKTSKKNDTTTTCKENADEHFEQQNMVTIGGHSVRYPWSAISDWAWYRNVRYRTEERRVRNYIGYRNKLLSDIQYPNINLCSAVVSCQMLGMEVRRSKPVRKLMGLIILLGSIGKKWSILDIGISDIDLVRYRNGSWCRYRIYSDIGMKGFSPTFFVPILE
jgi:hypothetical protein